MARQRRVAIYVRTEQSGRDLADVQVRRLLGWLGVKRSQVLVYWDCCQEYNWPRAAFDRLLTDIGRGRVKVLAVSGLDRLTGNRHVLDQLLGHLLKARVAVASFREDKLGDGTGLDRYRAALDLAIKWTGAYYWAPVPTKFQDTINKFGLERSFPEEGAAG